MLRRSREGRPRLRPRLFVVLLLLLVFVAATVRLFVLPGTDYPQHADAIVVLGGWGERSAEGVRLARAGYAPRLVVSSPGARCPAPIPGVLIDCFYPQPFTTQGEARFIANAVRTNGWTRVIVVSSTDQVTRARLRVQRCTAVHVDYVSITPSAGEWPHAIAYQWAAMFKALVLQRSC